jgi:hypothetical protein
MGKSNGNVERDARIYARWNEGLSLAAIGREIKESHETVRLAVRLMERKAMWRAIERNAQRERITLLSRRITAVSPWRP